MLEMPLNADVECTDGPAGKLSHVVLDPNGLKITHIVVKMAHQDEDRLVPVEHVAQTEASHVRLDMSRDALRGLPLFTGAHYVDYQYENYTTLGDATFTKETDASSSTGRAKMIDEFVPEGLRALRSGAKVFANDDHQVGVIDELLMDSDSKQITHFTLQAGHFWGKKDIMLPLSAVSSADEDEILLKLSKDEVGQLPSTPIKGRYRQAGAVGGYELIARIFNAPGKAADGLESFNRLQKSTNHAIKLHNAAILVKDAEGKVTITETGELTPRKGRRIGALGGAMLGLLGGPVGVVIGAAAGAGLGHVSAKRWVDLGFPNDFLERMETHLTPGSSALVLLVESEYSESISQSMGDLGGVVLQHQLTDEIVAELLAEHGEGGGNA